MTASMRAVCAGRRAGRALPTSISQASATSGYAMVGVAVNQSAAASGHRIWVLVQGMLGDLKGSLYKGVLWALASTNTAKGNGLRAVSQGAAGLV